MIVRRGAQDEDECEEEAAGRGDAVASALADDDGKKRGEEEGREGERGGGPGDYCTRPSVEGYRGTFRAKIGFLPQKCPENPPRSPPTLPSQGLGEFGAVRVLPYDVIPRAIPQSSYTHSIEGLASRHPVRHADFAPGKSPKTVHGGEF
jgi:hypothetical protein